MLIRPSKQEGEPKEVEDTDKPLPFSYEKEFDLLRTSYEQTYYGRDFWEDYYNIGYIDFQENINHTGGAYAETLYYRNMLLGNISPDPAYRKEMMKEARKYTTPEIDEWMNKDIINSEQERMFGVLRGLGSTFRNNAKKKAEKDKRR